jgi:hypothetical protein
MILHGWSWVPFLAMIENTRLGVKSKANTKSIERTAKSPWQVGLSERAKPKKVWSIVGDIRHYLAYIQLFHLKTTLWLVGTKSLSPWTQPLVHHSLYQTEHSKKVWSAHPGLESLPNLSWPWGPLPTLCSCTLLSWWGACYFSEKSIVSHTSFTCLLLKCVSHPKWSHLCLFPLH